MSSSSQRANFEAWTGYSGDALSRNADDDYCIEGVENEWRAYQAAQQACLSSPEVQDLMEALKVLVDNGGIGQESMFEDARDALAAMEKLK